MARKNINLRRFDFLLLLIGIFIFFAVGIISYKQLAHHKLYAEVKGFVLNSGQEYALSGYLENKYFTNSSIEGSLISLDRMLPNVGKFVQTNGKWNFILSKNIFSAKTNTANNLLFPKAYFEGSYENVIEPLSKIPEEKLRSKKLVFIDRTSGLPLLKLGIETYGEEKIAAISSLVRTPLNLLNNNDEDSIKIIEKNKYELKENDPTRIILLPQKNADSENEAIIAIKRKNANKYFVNFSGKDEVKISRANNKTLWNGWLLEFSGIYSRSHIFFLLMTLILGINIFLRLYSIILENDQQYTRTVESRILRLFSVYILFSVLSIIFINFTWLSKSYSRAVGFEVMLVLMIMSWYITRFFILKAQKNKFYEGTKLFSLSGNINRFFTIKTLSQYLFFLLVFILSILLVGSFTSNERFVIPGIPFGIPILHISKILLCLIVFLFRKNLFKGDLGAHLFLWFVLITASIATGDFSSLIFSIFSYIIVSFILTRKLILPNFFKIRRWYKFYNSQEEEIPNGLLANSKILFSYFSIIIIGLIFLLSQHVTKLYRFMLPYFSPSDEIFVHLNNQHKETYAKMFWSLDYILNNPGGTWANFRAINFFTTWHTDLSFLSWLQYGGVYILILFVILFSFLMYDSFYSIFGIRKIINKDMIMYLEDQTEEGSQKAKKAKKIIDENIFVYFLIVYLFIQTIYPIFSNLNLLPMIGAPIPCLSVSLVEYLLTPLFLMAIYFYTGRIIHHDDLLMNTDYKNEEKAFGSMFEKQILNGISGNSIRIIIVSFVILILFFLALDKYSFSPIFHREKIELTQTTAAENIIEQIIDRVDKDSITGEEYYEKLVNEASTAFNSIGTGWWNRKFGKTDNQKKKIINEVRSFVFRKDLVGRLENKSLIRWNEETNKLYIDESSLIKKRTVFKSDVIDNISFKNYFAEKSSPEIGDMSLSHDTKIVANDNKFYISSSALSELNNHSFSSVGNTLPNTNYLYDGITNEIIYKNVNGNRVKVLRYPSLGDVELLSDTYDADLQAIITMYLQKFINISPDEMRFSSLVIAENKTGNVIVMASAPSFANKFGGYSKKDFASTQYISTKDIQSGDSIQISLFSSIDEKGLKNFSLAETMIGSTVKPLYTFGALSNPTFNLRLDIKDFITYSRPGPAVMLFKNQFENSTFQQNMYDYFDMRIFDSVSYKKNYNDSINFLSNRTSVIAGRNKYTDLWNYNTKGHLSQNAIQSAAWGQGSINMSLTGLVRNYIRIKERKPIALKLYKKDLYNPGNEWRIDTNRIQQLYDGMKGAIRLGTASNTIGKALKANGLALENYMGKTGTSQFPSNTVVGQKGRNKNSFMMLITPNYTIGVSLSGNLPNGGISGQENEIIHAKGILQELIFLLAKWRDGKYLN